VGDRKKEAAEADDPMTQTDLSILAAVKSPPSGSARTGGLVEGDGAFLAYLGQKETPARPADAWPASQAANRPAPMATATQDDMISLATLPQQQDQIDPHAPVSAATRPPIDDPNRVAQEPESDKLTADEIATPAPSLLGMPLPALGSTAPTENEVVTTQQPASANAWQRSPLSDVSGTDAAPLDAPDLPNTPNAAVNSSPKTSPTQVPPTNSARPTETGSVPAPLPDLHMFKTSGRGAVTIAQTESNPTLDLPGSGAQNIPSNLASADLPTALEGRVGAKSNGAGAAPDPAISAQTAEIQGLKLPPEPGPSLSGSGQIAAIPRNDVALLASQPVQQSLGELPLRAPQTANSDSNQFPSLHPQLANSQVTATLPGAASTSAIALLQGQESQVPTISQPSPQPPEVFQVAPPITQAQTNMHGPEAALRSMLPATETSARTAYTSVDDAAELASNPDRKSLYANVFAPTGFSASPAHAVAQPSAAQPTAVPVAAIAEQIKTHSAAGKPTTIELTLTPEDLGKIRLVMVPDGEKIRVVIHADRPETLDLIRRSTDSFSADLRQAGYSNASFSFGSSNGRQPDQQAQGPALETPADTAPVSPAITKSQSNRPNLGGLDLRV
jgi:flagellar hook-length control protein FliK